MAESLRDYDTSVFINCPFDPDYKPMFEALVFTVSDCGYRARCALEVLDAGQVRIERIVGLVRACRYGIHDISRTELNASGLPRFNMPFELGLFLGATRFGNSLQRKKSFLILDRDRYRYQEYLSDIAGQDINAHAGQPSKAIGAIRNWLSAASPGSTLPGGAHITAQCQEFADDLPRILDAMRLGRDEMTFADFANIVSDWLSTRDRMA